MKLFLLPMQSLILMHEIVAKIIFPFVFNFLQNYLHMEELHRNLFLWFKQADIIMYISVWLLLIGFLYKVIKYNSLVQR